MSSEWPKHELYDKLSEIASNKLPELDFSLHKKEPGSTSFISKDEMLVTVQHGGYDMPYILIGTIENKSIIEFQGTFEYYLDINTPIYKKYKKVGAFYDFEYENELLSTHYLKILELINSPQKYDQWKTSIDIWEIVEIMNS